MLIWEHAHILRDDETVEQLTYTSKCPHCGTLLTTLRKNIRKEKPFDGGSLTGTEDMTGACMLCGWWVIRSTSVSSNSIQFTSETYAAVASLKNLDLSDLSTPIAEIQSFLAAKYEARFDLHPRLFEQTVASVLVPEGFTSRVTGYTKDGGIDVIFDGPNGELIGIQVKRYRNNISVGLIREFTGALVMAGLTKGIFVTTSGFTRDAREGASAATERDYRIELIDAERFFNALELVQRRCYQDKEELIASIGTPYLQRISLTNVLKPSEP